MAGYKVSYDVLSGQGDALRSLAKKVDSYSSRVDAVRGKLGDDQLLEEVRRNLQKVSAQLGESRAVLNMAAEVVEKCVGEYQGTEQTNVRRVSSSRAYNRDFYQKPVSHSVAEIASGIANAAETGTVPSAAGESSAVSTPVFGIPDPVPVQPSTVQPSTGQPMTADPLSASGNSPTVENLITDAASHSGVQAIRPDSPAQAGLSGTDASSFSFASAAVGAAVGAAAGAGATVGAGKLRAFLKKKAEEDNADMTSALSDEELEVRLQQAKTEAEKYQNPEELSESAGTDKLPPQEDPMQKATD